jgi:hypothetical protein
LTSGAVLESGNYRFAPRLESECLEWQRSGDVAALAFPPLSEGNFTTETND